MELKTDISELSIMSPTVLKEHNASSVLSKHYPQCNSEPLNDITGGNLSDCMQLPLEAIYYLLLHICTRSINTL